jgi:TPR repeat protein
LDSDEFLADQRDADAQFRYVYRLLEGKGVSIDWRKAADSFKLSADQGNASGQFYYGFCLLERKGVSIDLRNAAY